MQKKYFEMKSDFDLYEEMKSGSKFAYQVIFKKYYTQLTRFALLYVKDKDISEDIVQELFVKFWIKKESIVITTSIKSYLYKAVRNKSLNYFRDKKNDLSIDTDLDLIDSYGGSEEIIEIDYDELKIRINSSIESLPDKCKNIFKLSREQELTYKQIAEKLNISQKTVENQMGIALKKLREKLHPVLQGLISLLISFF